MSIVLCNNLNLGNILSFLSGCIPRRKMKKRDRWLLEILEEIVEQIKQGVESESDYIFHQILNKSIQLTGSEYGFIGEIKSDLETGKEYLHTYSITNIAWNNTSKEFFKKYINEELRFNNLESRLFGIPVMSGKAFITNRYNSKRHILPEGHPKIKRFMCIPVIINNHVRYIIGMANKRENYIKKDVHDIRKIMSVTAIIYSGYDMSSKP